MRFRPNWDSYLVSTLSQCPSTSSKSVLSTYPPGYTTEGRGEVEVPNDIRPTLLCPKHFGSDGMLRQVFVYLCLSLCYSLSK